MFSLGTPRDLADRSRACPDPQVTPEAGGRWLDTAFAHPSHQSGWRNSTSSGGGDL